MDALLPVIGYTAVLLALYEAFRRYPKLGIAVFSAGPLLLTPVWLESGVLERYGWFGWAKTYTVSLSAAFVLWLRLPSSQRFAAKTWPHRVAWALLFINILEAVVKDALGGHTPNAIAGAILAVLIPGLAAWKVRDDDVRDYTVALPLAWVGLYVVWNVAFVLGNYPFMMYRQAALMAAPLLVGLWAVRGTGYDPRCWLQGRVYTLAVHALLIMSFLPIFEAVGLELPETGQPSPWADEVGLAAIVIAVGLAAWAIRGRSTEPALQPES